MQNWSLYNAKKEFFKPHPLVIRSLALAFPQQRLRQRQRTHDGTELPWVAVDLGSGIGNEVLALAQEGFRVHGIDGDQTGHGRLRSRLIENGISERQVILHHTQFENLWEIPEADFIYSLFSLCFCSLGEFHRILNLCRQSLRDQGCLSLTIFDPADDWARKGLINSLSRAEIEIALADFALSECKYVEMERPTLMDGLKLWKFHEVIATIL